MTRHFDRDHEAFSDSTRFVEQGSTPTTPASGERVLFAKTDGFHDLDSTGAVIGPLGSGVTDLLTGDSSLFAATIGAWVNTGGTLTWSSDSTYFITGASGSLKFVTTANAQYADVPLAGTFLSGHVYDAFVWLAVEENVFGAVDGIGLRFGLLGTDELVQNPGASLVAGEYFVNANGAFIPIYARWKPTANRTGVTLRITRNLTIGAATVTAHIGHARVAEVIGTGSIGLAIVANPYPVESSPVLYLCDQAGISAGPFTNLLSHDSGGSTFQSPYGYLSLRMTEDRAAIVSSSGGLVLPTLSAAPGTPVEGESYYDTTLHKTRTWDGSAWQNHW